MTGLGFDPLSVLGCDEDEFRTVMRGRPVTPGEVEAAARRHYRWRAHLDDDDSYWVTVHEAAQILDTSTTTVRRLLAAGRLPHLTHVSGVNLIARSQVHALLDGPVAPPLPGSVSGSLPVRTWPRRGS